MYVFADTVVVKVVKLVPSDRVARPIIKADLIFKTVMLLRLSLDRYYGRAY